MSDGECGGNASRVATAVAWRVERGEMEVRPAIVRDLARAAAQNRWLVLRGPAPRLAEALQEIVVRWRRGGRGSAVYWSAPDLAADLRYKGDVAAVSLRASLVCVWFPDAPIVWRDDAGAKLAAWMTQRAVSRLPAVIGVSSGDAQGLLERWIGHSGWEAVSMMAWRGEGGDA